MYRKEIKVMDCTVRDGGLMNNWQFSDDFVRAVYQACVKAGIDYMEIGYKSSESAFSRDEVGPWKFCDDKDLRRAVGNNKTALKFEYKKYLAPSDFCVDIVRRPGSSQFRLQPLRRHQFQSKDENDETDKDE